jgi:hypothetical protein
MLGDRESEENTSMKLTSRITILAILIVGMLIVSLSVHGQTCDPSEYGKLKNEFRQKPAATQGKIWRNHIRFALKVEDLSKAQKEIANDFLALLKDEVYSTALSAADRTAAFTAISNRITQNFSKEQQVRIFYTLTIEEMKGFSLVPARYKSVEGIGSCNCSDIGHPLCDMCIMTGWPRTCNESDWGCGPGWILACNGRCWNEGDPPLIT